MASLRERKFENIVEYSLHFEGLVESSIRAKLTVEVLKYLIHQRGQIPLSYEQIRKDVERKGEEFNGSSSIRRKPCLEARRQHQAITALQSIFQSLEAIFNSSHPVKEVLLVFGSTIVSPREMYRLRFPVQCYDGHILGWTACRMTLFQQLVSADIFSDARPMRPGTKLTVLVLAPREGALSGLMPRPSFRIPHRGRHFVFNLEVRGCVVNPDMSLLSDTSFNISGVEPLSVDNQQVSYSRDTPTATRSCQSPLSSCQTPGIQNSQPLFTTPSNCAVPHLKYQENKVKTARVDSFDKEEDHKPAKGDGQMRCDSIKSNSVETAARGFDQGKPDTPQPEYIWFQIPTTMTGFKDKSSKTVTTTSYLR